MTMTYEQIAATQNDRVLTDIMRSQLSVPSLRDVDGKLREQTDAEYALTVAVRAEMTRRGLSL